MPIIGQSDCESLGNGDDFRKRAINFAENVGMVGAVGGDFINSLRGMPSHEAERIGTTDPVAAALGATFTTVAIAGLPMLGARAVLESPTATLEAVALARVAIARSDIALLSGLTGMAGSGAGQVLGEILQGNPIELNWGDVGIAGNIGAVAGWAGPRFTAFRPGSGKVAWWISKIGTGMLGALANTAQYGITQFDHDLPITSRGMVISMGTGAFGGLLAGNITSPRYGAFHWDNAFRNANVGLGTFFRSLGGSMSTNIDFETALQTMQNKIGCPGSFLP